MAGFNEMANASRETMAMGESSIGADHGMLPELVKNGVSGFVVKDKSEELCHATLKLLQKGSL